jgi:hypothetical protein
MEKVKKIENGNYEYRGYKIKKQVNYSRPCHANDKWTKSSSRVNWNIYGKGRSVDYFIIKTKKEALKMIDQWEAIKK